MGHPTFSPTPSPLTPRPGNGLLSGPDQNGCVLTWAHQEAIAQFKKWAAANDQHCKAVVRATLADLDALDQVADVDPSNPAVNKGTPAVRFAMSGPAMPALDGAGNPVLGAQAWDGSKCLVADDTLLTNGYYVYLNQNLARGYTGQQGAVA